MSKHKYSTYTLITMLTIFLTISVVALLESEDIDEICNTNTAQLIRTNGQWICHQTHYAQGWFHNLTNPNVITISSTDTYYNVTGFNIDNYFGIDALGNSVRINKNGTYKLTGTMSFRGGNNGNYEWKLFINNNAKPACAFHRTTTSTNIGDATMSCIFPLKENDLIQIKVEDKSAPAQNVEIVAMNFNLLEVY